MPVPFDFRYSSQPGATEPDDAHAAIDNAGLPEDLVTFLKSNIANGKAATSPPAAAAAPAEGAETRPAEEAAAEQQQRPPAAAPNATTIRVHIAGDIGEPGSEGATVFNAWAIHVD